MGDMSGGHRKYLTQWETLWSAQQLKPVDPDAPAATPLAAPASAPSVGLTYYPDLSDDAPDLGRALVAELVPSVAPVDPSATPKQAMLEGRTLGRLNTAESNDPTLTPPRSSDHAALTSSPWMRSINRHVDEPFEIIQEVGRGGMGVVYLARQALLNRQIAVKMSRSGTSLKKFAAEAIILAHLEHPNIVPVYDLALMHDQRFALAMKFIDGQAWSLRLFDPAISLNDHLSVLMSVCNAISFAHSKDIAHLDIKPANVLVGEFGEVLVVDWGIALDISDPPRSPPIAPHRTSLRSPCGTPAYMAPEMARGDATQIGTQTDVYLLGAVLYEILTQRPPHDTGEGAMKSIFAALDANPPDFSDHPNVPTSLREICTRAMAREPRDRYGSVAEMQQALSDFHTHAESMRLCQQAAVNLDAARNAGPNTSHDTLYNDITDAVTGFSQARLLWPQNPDALIGEVQARLEYARIAASRGDLSLAEAQLRRILSADPPFSQAHLSDAKTALSAVEASLRAQARSRTTLKRLRLSLAAVTLAVIAGLLVAYVWIDQQRQAASDARGLAEQRLDDIQRLSDVKRLQDLLVSSKTLWPATPPSIPTLQQWLSDAHSLLPRRAEHAQRLERLKQSLPQTPSIEAQWELDLLTQLLNDLETLEFRHIPDLQRRLDFAQTVAQRTLSDHAQAWEEAAQAIAADPRFRGLRLNPQLGLVPLGPDPDSKFWEFAHLQSGDVPARGPDGRLQINPNTAIILVLLPGGTARMGAHQAPLGAPFADPDARPSEGPPHDVHLDPFFFGKYEMTQAQWMRINDYNPSAYRPGLVIANHTINGQHPVEQVSRAEALGVMQQFDLTLPTEAQWEYATRAGTSTVYWTGDDPESLQGALNIADRFCKENGGPGSWRYETFLDDGFVTHAPVGMFKPNPFGLHDTAGNVWEWCLDRYGDYTLPTQPGDGARQAPDDAAGVFRGGGFRAARVHARSADRYSLYTSNDYRGYDIGLRPARRIQP